MAILNFNYNNELKKAVESVPVTEPAVLSPNLGINRSSFPQTVDNLKPLVYITPDETVNAALKNYNDFMFKMYNGEQISNMALSTLNENLNIIKNYIQSSDKLNLLTNAINNLQKYCKDYLFSPQGDLAKRYDAMNTELANYVSALNSYMIELESYFDIPNSDLSLPNNSITREHLDPELQANFDYIQETEGVLIQRSETIPVLPSGNKNFIWIKVL